MRESFDEAMRRVLAHEGGYTNHPSDPGGPTNFGITIHDYRKHVNPRATAADVRAMPLQHAKAIYRTHYWDAQCCDALPAGLDYSVFDYGVNSGIGRASKVLRRVCGLSDDTHRVTEAVLQAVAQREPADLIAAVNDERLAFLKRLRTWPVFGVGWGRRVASVRAASLRMAAQSAAADANEPAAAPAPGKGSVPINKPAQRGTAGGIAAGGAAAAEQAHQSGARPAVIAAIVAAFIILAVLGWLAWRWRQKRLQEN